MKEREKFSRACPVVQGWVKAGRFDLAELKEHVKTCAVCQGLLREAMEAWEEMTGDESARKRESEKGV